MKKELEKYKRKRMANLEDASREGEKKGQTGVNVSPFFSSVQRE